MQKLQQLLSSNVISGNLVTLSPCHSWACIQWQGMWYQKIGLGQETVLHMNKSVQSFGVKESQLTLQLATITQNVSFRDLMTRQNWGQWWDREALRNCVAFVKLVAVAIRYGNPALDSKHFHPQIQGKSPWTPIPRVKKGVLSKKARRKLKKKGHRKNAASKKRVLGSTPISLTEKDLNR